MPIPQLKRPGQKKQATGFSSHRIGSNPSSASHTVPANRSFGHIADRRAMLRNVNRLADAPRRERRGGSAKKLFLQFVIKAGIVFLVGGTLLLGGAFVYYSKDLPDPNKIIERDIAQSTKIFDRTGEKLLYEIHGTERRTLIELSDVPQFAIDAAVSIEDKNFYKHKGLSFRHIAKAIVLEIAQKLHLYNGLVPGGSTLTQQFIKNAVLTTEKSYARKIKEFVLAYRMEQKFTKEEILKLYFNEIPYGSTAYGIEAASHIYFDKSAKDLTLAEAAVLAAMPQAPSYYSPYGSHKEELLGRQKYVLDLMVEQDYITEEQANAAKNQEVVFKRKREDITAPHFVFMVKEDLARRYGERLVEQGGLSIITTIDIEKQKAAEGAIAEFEKKNAETYNANNAGLVSIDVKTGEVVAFVGSKDYFNDDIDGQVNVANSLRQPGSSIKPVIYAEAFSKGYRPESVMYDLITQFSAGGKPYQPQNYDGKERGPVTFRQALQGSLNIPAVKVLYLVGVKRAVEFASELGYSTLTDPDRYGLSLVLGGAEVKLIEHTNAYATFAREGLFKPYVTVLKVQDNSGTVLEEHRDQAEKRVLPRETARILNNVLSDNSARAYIFGANNHLTLSGRPVAAKTGTTNDYHDAWTLGYTPQLATGVWVGNSDNAEMKQRADGSVIAAPIWQKYMNTVLAASPVEGFKAPEPLPSCDRPMLCGGTGSRTVKINSETGRLASPYTPTSKIKEVTYQEAHDILHYVVKDDPFGEQPKNPSNDPQYSLWETAVARWAEKEGIVNQSPPTDVDDQYKPEDQPTISWNGPFDNDTITNPNTTLIVAASAARGVARVSYFLNNVPIGIATSAPFSYTFTPTSATPNGRYTLAAIAADDIGNEAQAAITVTLNIPRSGNEWQVLLASPQPNGEYTAATLPDEIQLQITNPSQIQKIDVYYSRGGSTTFVGAETVDGKTLITLPWSRPTQPGRYSLRFVITDAGGLIVNYPESYFEIRE